MHQPRYDLVVSPNRSRYEFVSVGPRGSIRKVVEYTYLDELAIWNLGFGDVNPVTDEISDDVISDNEDGRKVMTTVLMTLFTFFGEYSGDTVILLGAIRAEPSSIIEL